MQNPGATSARNVLDRVRLASRDPLQQRSRARDHVVEVVAELLEAPSRPGADAPKCSIEIESPWSPTHSLQPSATPGSTESRAFTSGGSTSSR